MHTLKSQVYRLEHELDDALEQAEIDYNEACDEAPSAEEIVTGWGFRVTGRSERPHHRDERLAYRVLWLDHDAG